ncbi:acyltransferase [Paenibacillus antri]|uniref:Acyltransferase n=1 Tax=Paenibacillus antri TaxID=2582848 RepID=A0A5R9G0V6_9BACL|nr:acyltransferase [Paenibacillus antri]TLS49411.1 acyltransferase [Paenibacillus antri]
MSNRIESFDSVRGIASMVVVIFHCLISFPLFHDSYYSNKHVSSFLELFTNTPLHLVWAGKEAVLLFFILSGFVLALPFLKERPPAYASFAIKRFFRIYIPYIVVMAVSCILLVLFAQYQPIESLSHTYNERWNHPLDMKALTSYLLMINYDLTNVNGVVWTLFHEMRISFVFPLIMLVVARNSLFRSFTALFVMIAIAYVGLGFLSNYATTGLLSAFIFSVRESVYYMLFFALGAFLAKYKDVIAKSLQRAPFPLKAGVLLLAISTVSGRWLYWFVDALPPFVLDVVSAAGILAMFSCILSMKRLDRVLSGGVLMFLGKISYSLYLVHIPVLMLVGSYAGRLLPLPVAFAFVPAVSVIAAAFVYKYVEQPAIWAGRSVAKHMDTKKRNFVRKEHSVHI